MQEPIHTEIPHFNVNPILLRYYDAALTAAMPAGIAVDREESIDFNQYLRPNPATSFVIRIKDDSMTEASIPTNALLVVDRSVKPENNMIVAAVVNGEFMIKRFVKNRSGIRLMPANARYQPIPITEDMAFKIWGTVTSIIIDTLK